MARRESNKLGYLVRRLTDALKFRSAHDLVTLAAEMAGADHACLALRNDSGDMEIAAPVPLAPSPEVLALVRQVSAQAIASDGPVRFSVSTADRDQASMLLCAKAGCCLMLPIIGDRTTGVIVLLSSKPDAFGTRMELLEQFARLAGCILDNLRLRAVEDEAARVNSILRRTARTLRRAETVSDLLSEGTREATEEVSAAAGCSFLWDENTKAFQVASVWARNQKQATFFNSVSWDRTVALRRIQEKKGPVMLEARDCQTSPGGLAESLEEGTLVAAPIAFEDRFLGALLVGPFPRPSPSDIQIETLKGICRQIGAGIQNIRMEEGIKKLESKLDSELVRSQLLSMVSHELRTPLTSIKGYATTLLRYYDKLPDSEKMEFIRYIGEASDRLNTLLNDLLDTSKLEAGLVVMDKTRLDLSELVERTVEEFQRRGTGYEFATDMAPDMPEVTADAKRVQQVLSNLLDNAVKYSPQGETITVRCQRQGSSLQVSISDRGPGIPPEHLSRIFEPFYQVQVSTAGRKGGVGLGLAICQRLVQAHHGRIWAESEQGKGSTFCFTLPLPETSCSSDVGRRPVY